MPPRPPPFSHWYFDVASLILAVAIYLLLARLVLAPLFAPDHAVMRWLRVLTNPFWASARALAPSIVPAPVITLLAIIWLFAARMILTVVGPTG